MEYKEKFADRLVKLRESNNISQQELADSLGVTRQSLSLYEKAERTINIDLLAKIADFFNVSTDYLLGITGNPSKNPDITNACNVTGLDEEAIKSLISRSQNGKHKLNNLNKLLINYHFFEALDVLEKYNVTNRIIEKRLKKSNISTVNIDIEKELTEHEKAERNAEIFLEDCGYIVLTSDFDILDFYKQRFTSLIAESVEDVAKKDYETFEEILCNGEYNPTSE